MKDAPPPRPNKRPRLDASTPANETSSASTKSDTSKAKDLKSVDASSSNNRLEKEFLQVMQPRTKKGPSWADGEIPQPVASTSTAAEPSTAKKPKGENPSADPAAMEDQQTEEAQPDAEVVSDMDWLKRHMRPTLDDELSVTDKVFEQSDDEDEEMPDGATADADKVLISSAVPQSKLTASIRLPRRKRTQRRRRSFRQGGCSCATCRICAQNLSCKNCVVHSERSPR